MIMAAGTLAASATSALADEDPVAQVKARYPACTKKATDDDVTAAAGAHRAAMEAFDRFQYAQAVRLWTDAYTFDCTRPKVFINIGQAYERDGDKAGALAVYELLLERAPADAPADLTQKVEALREAVKREAEERKRKADAEAKKAAESQAKRGPAEPDEEASPPLGIVPWIGVGVGGAAAIAGGVLLGVGLTQASSAADECADPAARTGCPQTAVDDGEAGETMSMVGQGLLYAGGGILVASLVVQLVVNQPPSTEPAAATVTPLAGPGFGGVAFSGRF